MIKQMLVPMPVEGTQDAIPDIPGYEWIKKLPNKKIYFALFQRWPKKNLPAGYDYYIVSFHLETVDLNWIKRQQVPDPIVVLSDGQSYGLDIPRVHFLPFFYWHYQLQKMQEWFGTKEKSTPKYKFSAVCNRISQSKIWTTTKLLESAKESSLIVLNSWMEEKNVHNWQNTGNDILDDLTTIFRNKYVGQILKIDDFNNTTQNSQHITGNPWQPLYTDCVINFTNESFHYSGMQENGSAYIWPGPFITEKTLKCLLAGTAFIPVGQFETYTTLGKLGLEFNYGFDTTWDNDSGNLSRAHSIIELIDYLNQLSINKIVKITHDNNLYNQNYILTNKFYNSCHNENLNSIEQVFKVIQN